MIKITHLTSVHPRYDTRIFIKECSSLAKIENYKVSLVVADGLGDEEKSGVAIYDIGKLEGRLNRIFKISKKVLVKAIELDSDIYHLHDPELMLIGLRLKKLGKKVIFDAHEDLPKQVMAKHYLNRFVKKILSLVISRVEIFILKKLDYVVTATPLIKEKFLAKNIETIDINNFPILNELIAIEPTFQTNTLCYIGLLYETRGVKEIVQAIEGLNVKLIIAGKFFDKNFEEEIRGLAGWKQVDFRGFVDREGVKKILEASIAGLVTLHPTPSYIEAYPVKMFEYMSAGIAVISSNFPLYKSFVEKKQCGICVDPLNIEDIRKAIILLCEDKKQAKHMGREGKKAVVQYYNWAKEETKLFELYERLT
jgi:glycosyltransferase involved in cell wall biosynthesis